jgi:hypothetical protein
LIGAAVDLDDHEMPSGTSAAYALLAQLGNADPHYAEAATKILARMSDQIAAAPVNWASLTAYAALHGPSTGTNPKGVLDSAAHVKATAKGASLGDYDEILVTLTIEPGCHVNTNPATSDYLIPTAVTLPGVPNAKVNYPAGQVLKPKFLPEGIMVYQGSVDIRAELPKGGLDSAARQPLRVDLQACTTQICLPPATLNVSVRQ